jgi:hypothetical protein
MNWKLILHYTKKHSCKSELLWYCGSWEENISMTLPYFCDFEEDLNLHLNKFEFQSCKKCLFQVWLKLTWCFILKDSFQYTNIKIVSPLVSPTLTLGDHNLYKLKSALSQKAFIEIWVILARWFSRKNLVNDLAKFFAFLWLSPLWKGPGPLLVWSKISFTQEWFVPCLIEIGLLVVEKIFFNINM